MYVYFLLVSVVKGNIYDDLAKKLKYFFTADYRYLRVKSGVSKANYVYIELSKRTDFGVPYFRKLWDPMYVLRQFVPRVSPMHCMINDTANLTLQF